MSEIIENYKVAKDIYKRYGVDTDLAIEKLSRIPISINCWQLDDVQGFEKNKKTLSGGIAVTGAYEGLPSDITEFKQHLSQVLNQVPGTKKLSLHAIYLDTEEEIDRDEIEPHHYSTWVEFAKEHNIGLDFNPTCFSHPLSSDGFTLSHADESVRKFWIEHVKRSRKISEYFGKELGVRSINNIWIPDGFKDEPADRLSPRLRLKESLDEIFTEKIDSKYSIDALESKLFGIGSESYVVGSNEFYTNYVAQNNNAIICLDTGHFHPTERVSEKISAYLSFNQEVLLHVSRPVRWDSDHVVIFDDETKAIMKEIVRNNALDKVHIALDFFDGSINRIQASTIGTRNTIKALLNALLEPVELIQSAERLGDYTTRLAISEEVKMLPIGFVWDYYCYLHGVDSKEIKNEG